MAAAIDKKNGQGPDRKKRAQRIKRGVWYFLALSAVVLLELPALLGKLLLLTASVGSQPRWMVELPRVLNCLLGLGLLIDGVMVLLALGSILAEKPRGQAFAPARRAVTWLVRLGVSWLVAGTLHLGFAPALAAWAPLENLGRFVRGMFYFDEMNARKAEGVRDALETILELLELAMALACVVVGVMLLYGSIKSAVAKWKQRVRKPRAEAKAKPAAGKGNLRQDGPGEREAAGQHEDKVPKAIHRVGVSGLSADAAAAANSRLAQLRAGVKPDPLEGHWLRIKLLSANAMEPEKMYLLTPEKLLRVRLEKYEMDFMLEDGQAYLLGSRKLRLEPNQPYLVRSSNRLEQKHLTITYIN